MSSATATRFAPARGWRIIHNHRFSMPNPFQVIKFDTEPVDFPLRERVGLRWRIATFESQFKRGLPKTIKPDVEFIAGLPLGICAYGASDCKIYPFICAPSVSHRSLPFCSIILSDLGVKAFKSGHLSNLARRTIKFIGNHHGTQSDEIHTDPEDQFIFSKMGEDPHSMDAHKLLRNHVLKSHLYYVLLHTIPHKHEEFWFSDWVILFALGVSPQTGNLIGVVTHQTCHNLCD